MKNQEINYAAPSQTLPSPFSGRISQSHVSILFMYLFMCLLLASMVLAGIIFERTVPLILIPSSQLMTPRASFR